MGKRTKHSPPQKKTSFIKFSKLQVNYLNEVQFRQAREWNEALDSVYEALGLREKILQAPRGTYNLRLDCGGLDIVAPPPAAKGKKIKEKTEESGKKEEPEPQDISEEKSGKDN